MVEGSAIQILRLDTIRPTPNSFIHLFVIHLFINAFVRLKYLCSPKKKWGNKVTKCGTPNTRLKRHQKLPEQLISYRLQKEVTKTMSILRPRPTTPLLALQ